MLVLVGGALLGSCEQKADQVSPIEPEADTDTTICRLLKVIRDVTDLPQFSTTSELTYDSQGRVDSAIQSSADFKKVTKFYYSIDDNPDSVITTNLPPSLNPGAEFRTYYGYDNQRRQISRTVSSDPRDIMRYTYNSHGQLSMRDREFFMNGVQVFDTIWFHYPDHTTHNFNNTSGRGINGQWWTGVFYAYDNHPLPLKLPMSSPIDVGNFGWGVYTDNNIVGIMSNGMQQYKFAYTYNDAGYPLVQSDVMRSPPPVTWTFTYYCETIELP